MKYDIFFFNEPFQYDNHDKEWTHNVIERLGYCGYTSGCRTDDFDAVLSVHENDIQNIQNSILLAFVISENSVKLKAFMRYLETAVKFIIDSEDSKPMLPVLLNKNSILPPCLSIYNSLTIPGNIHWWQQLLNVLNHCTLYSSSGETDEELKDKDEKLKTYSINKSYKEQKKYCHFCKGNGIIQLTSQMGTRSIYESLMKGCGVEIVEHNLILKWDRFENVMIENRDTVVSIVNFNQDWRIREVTIYLTKDGQDRIVHRFPEWKVELVKFIEQSLNHDFCRGNYDRMAYNVTFEGNTNYALLYSMNNIARNLYLDNCKSRCPQFDTIEKRIATFHNWPYVRNIDRDLAEAGYIYTGEEDTVVCFSCNQSLYGFKQKTLTREMCIWPHILWSDDCNFLNKLPESTTRSFLERKLTYGKDLVNPYIPDPSKCNTLYEKTRINHRVLKKLDMPFNAFMLAKVGFVISSSPEMELLVLCQDCKYIKYGVKSIEDLEYNHMMWSGEDCPFLLRRKGIEGIQQFKKDNELRVRYTSSISIKTIMVNLNN